MTKELIYITDVLKGIDLTSYTAEMDVRIKLISLLNDLIDKSERGDIALYDFLEDLREISQMGDRIIKIINMIHD